MLASLSLEANMCLTKMGLIYERVEGRRFKLSDIGSVVSLINSSLEAVNAEYKKYFEEFLNQLTHAELRELVDSGAVIYRGAVVPEATETAPASTTPRLYRGNVVEAEPAKAKPAEAPAEDTAPEKKKPVKMYRGRPVSD